MTRPERRGSPVMLERVLEGVLRQCGLEGRVVQRRALEEWESIVGSAIAAHARAVDLAEGVLTLQADHGAWRQEVTLLMPQIVAAFNSRCGPGTVTSIQWARAATGRHRRDNPDGHLPD